MVNTLFADSGVAPSFVAIGDSFTEGLNDPAPGGGFRGWADRLASLLAAEYPGLRYANLAVRPMGQTQTRYHVALDVADKPGVLASVATAFAAHDVSIQTVRQQGHGSDATLVIVTHTASDAALSATVADLRNLSAVRAVSSVMPCPARRRRTGSPPQRGSRRRAWG